MASLALRMAAGWIKNNLPQTVAVLHSDPGAGEYVHGVSGVPELPDSEIFGKILPAVGLQSGEYFSTIRWDQNPVGHGFFCPPFSTFEYPPPVSERTHRDWMNKLPETSTAPAKARQDLSPLAALGN